MLSSIHPLGERARRNRWGVTATAYVIGSSAGGLAAGAMAGLLGQSVGAAAGHGSALPFGLAAAACVVGAMVDAERPLRVGLPTVRRQVNEDWLTRYRGWVYGVGFGFQLGLGVATIVTTSAIYVCGAVALSLGWVAHGVAGAVAAGSTVGGTFGLARALPLLSRARTADPAGLRAAHRRLMATDRLSRQLTVTVMGVGGGILGMVAAL